MSDEPVLGVRDLQVRYQVGLQQINAVNDVSLDVRRGEMLGLVGESGSGKSSLALAVLGLLPGNGKVLSGEITLSGRQLMDERGQVPRTRRWRELAYVPQGAMSVLNPVLKVRRQFEEILIDHDQKLTSQQRKKKALTAMQAVGLDAEVLGLYPHELSGGMKQRVCIALATLLGPSLIIADEPTSALDVVSQRRVIELLKTAKKTLRTSVILIGHDMALQAQAVDRLAIMYQGQLVEVGRVADIFKRPQHAYTKRLIAAVPSIREKRGVKARVDSGSPTVSLSGDSRLEEIGIDHYVLR